MTVRLEGIANRTDATVHHVRGCHHIGTRGGMAQCLFDQCIAGHIVQHVARVIDNAVLPMRGVRIKRDVCDHAELGHGRLELGNSALYQAIRLISRLSQ